MPTPTADEVDFDALAAAQKAARRKVWLIVFGTFGVLFALFSYAFIADEEPPDLSDLRVTFTHPPEEENAYALLTKFVATLPPDPSESTPEEIHSARIFENEVAWDQTVVASVLSRYSPDLADTVRTALQAPESEAPEIKSFADLVPEVAHFRSLAKILTQQAALAWHTGDHTRAAELNLLALHLGSRISQSRGGLISVLVSAAIEGIALTAIQKHSDSPDIPPEVLRHYLAQIGRHEIRPEDYHTAYKLESVFFANIARNLGTNDFGSITGAGKSPLHFAMALPGVWQPNRTVRWHAECMRAAIAGTKMPDYYESVPWPHRAQNMAGRILLTIMVPSLSQVTTACHRIRANLRLTQIYVALRLYQLEHNGTLPADLAELVHEYLPAVPLDPFGGQPLRYNRDLTTIWSIDKDHLTITDADGDFPARNMPAYRLRFARPPAEPLPSFEEYEARQNTGTGLFGNP